MTELPTIDGMLCVSVDITGADPRTLFDYWTTPERLTRWWPKEAVLGTEVGGEYRLIWTGEMESVMQGTITAFEPGRTLGFTWRWNFEPEEKEPLNVLVAFEPLPDIGTRLLIEHGPLDPEADARVREGLLGGWEFFLEKLQDLVTAEG